jgi:ATP-dependent helicase YprA (DUF1998 family)
LEKLKKEIEERKKANIQSKPTKTAIEVNEPINNSFERDDQENNDSKFDNNQITDEVKLKQDPEITHQEFKVLGGNEFEKKLKVNNLIYIINNMVIYLLVDLKKIHENIFLFYWYLQVQRILPYWLSHPNSVSRNLQSHSFPVEKQIWLNDSLKSTLKSEGITHLFPVQAEVIPFILKEHSLSHCLWPHDVCVSAPTGSGKTLSFVLPIIQVCTNSK